MTENNEVPNDFVDQPEANAEQTTPAPEPSAVHEAVKAALAPGAAEKIELLPCACGAAEVNLVIDAPRAGEKVGRVSCSDCGAWGVDFLVPRTQDQELIGKKAAQAWNEAPRG